MKATLSRHDELLRAAIEGHNGYVFKTIGDAFCGVFTTAPDAIEAALDAQRALYAEEWGEVGPVRVRMALHTGSVQERDGDYFGPPVNRVARLLSVGHGGQVLLSLPTAEFVRDVLPPKATLEDLGDHRLKDLIRSEHIYQLNVPDLPSDFPHQDAQQSPQQSAYPAYPFCGQRQRNRGRLRSLEPRDVRLRLSSAREA